MTNETRTITVPVDAVVTISHNTTGQTEIKAPAPVTVPTRTASGLTPLYVVEYTSNGGKTATYGVFWEGMKNGDHRLGLRKMLASGHRMSKRSRFNTGFFVDAARCKRIG